MPVVWKSYESMVRLVSAIIAAHPDLKLNYTATAQYFPEATACALDHFFRPIKKEAKKLRDDGPIAIAGKFGDSTTPVAIGHVINRHIKANPHANLNKSMADNSGGGSATKSAGRAKKATGPAAKKPRAKATPKKERNEDDDEDMPANLSEDDFDVDDTPTKKSKTSLNRVQAGRIQKSRKAAPAPGAYAGLDNNSEDELDEQDQPQFSSPIKSPVKREKNSESFTMNSSPLRPNGLGSNGHVNSSPLRNGYSNGARNNGAGNNIYTNPYHPGTHYNNGFDDIDVASGGSYYNETDEA